MVVGGLPERCSRHAAEVASLALHVLDAVPKIRTARLNIRIGKYLPEILNPYLHKKSVEIKQFNGR